MKKRTDAPLFSIITVCRNAEAVLNDTLASLRQQIFKDFQFIVIDGDSTDNTPGILESYRCLIDIDIAEKDDGIFDAMNKGLRYAIGDYVYFLNAGDLLYDQHVLATVAASLANSPTDILYGDTLVIDKDSGKKVLRKPAIVDKISLWSRTINHQAVFAKREVFTKVGDFDTSFKMKADHDWIIRCYNHSCAFRYLPLTIAKYDYGGFSVKNWKRFIKGDRKLLHVKNYSLIGLAVMMIVRKFRFDPGKGYIRRILDSLI